MSQSSKRLTSILLALLLVVVSLVVFFDWIQPEYANVSALKGQVSGEQSFINNEQQALAQAQQLITSYKNQSQSTQQDVSLAMPNSQDLAGAIAQIYGIAQNNGLIIQSIGVSAPSLPADNQSQSSTAQVVRPLGTVSLQISGGGSYESLKNFLSGLETNVRIFNVKSVSIAQATAGSGKSNASQDLFNYNLGIATYYQTN